MRVHNRGKRLTIQKIFVERDIVALARSHKG